MRKLVILAALAIATLMQTGPQARAEVWYPWCAFYGGVGSMTYNCGFTSYQQCMATAMGAGAYCRQNPLPPSPNAQRRRKQQDR